MAELRIMPPPLVDVAEDGGGWIIGAVVAVAEGTGGAGSIGSTAGFDLSAISAA
jgi:hypothetical protein